MMVEEFKVSKTRAIEVAEFVTQGSWTFINYFEMGGALMTVNGVLQPNTEAGGFINGIVMGENLCYCALCGTNIMAHYTLQDKKTGRKLNIGEVCIANIDDLDKKEAVMKGLKSLKNKIVRQYKKRVHATQLVDFLNENIETINKQRNEIVDGYLDANPEHYWLEPEKEIVKFIDREEKTFKVKRTLWERKQFAEKNENYERDYYNHISDRISNLVWDARKMLEPIQESFDKDGIKLTVPKLRKLTDEENKQLGEMITKESNEYLERCKQK